MPIAAAGLGFWQNVAYFCPAADVGPAPRVTERKPPARQQSRTRGCVARGQGKRCDILLTKSGWIRPAVRWRRVRLPCFCGVPRLGIQRRLAAAQRGEEQRNNGPELPHQGLAGEKRNRVVPRMDVQARAGTCGASLPGARLLRKRNQGIESSAVRLQARGISTHNAHALMVGRRHSAGPKMPAVRREVQPADGKRSNLLRGLDRWAIEHREGALCRRPPTRRSRAGGSWHRGLPA